MKPPLLGRILAVGILLVATAGRLASANLIVNPGFETGDFSGWTFTTGPSSTSGVSKSNPHSGTFAVVLNDTTTPIPIEELSQTVSTSPGSFYDVSFWLFNSAGGSNSFIASFAGTALAIGGSPASPYAQHGFSVQATSGSSTMDFRDFNIGGEWWLDDVSVTLSRSVPDAGSSALLLGLGLVGLLGVHRALDLQQRV